MEFFPKIDTLYERNKDTFNVIEGAYRRPEFADIGTWLINEKLDGSNISIVGIRDHGEITTEWRGRTERAQFHKEAVAHLQERCDAWHPHFEKIMTDNDLASFEVFGELIGPKIQKGGIYTDKVTTKFYDIRVGGRLWLPWDAVLGYSQTLGYDVPWTGYGATEKEIVATVREGFDTFETAGTGGIAEGLICKTNTPLTNNAGKRLIFKLKTIDFNHGK